MEVVPPDNKNGKYFSFVLCSMVISNKNKRKILNKKRTKSENS